MPHPFFPLLKKRPVAIGFHVGLSAQSVKQKNKNSLDIIVTSLREDPSRNRSLSPATLRAFSPPHNMQPNSWVRQVLSYGYLGLYHRN